MIHTDILAFFQILKMFILREICKRRHCPPSVTLGLLLFVNMYYTLYADFLNALWGKTCSNKVVVHKKVQKNKTAKEKTIIIAPFLETLSVCESFFKGLSHVG